MPRQYIYTSARRGLEPGKSGFCCVARDRELPQDLQRELERLSRYERESSNGHPLILRYVSLQIRSGNYGVLSRIVDAGADYSRRDNHLAHHLIVTENEFADLPDPASILLAWSLWRSKWDEPPRILGERDQFASRDLDTQTISEVLEIKLPKFISDQSAAPAILTVERGTEYDVILGIRSALLALPAQQRWDHSFTNFLLTTDRPSQFTWSATWIDRELPYALALQSEKEPEPKSQHPSKEDETGSENQVQSASAASRLKALPAPVVEVPDTKPKRKRPKQKWTPKRISRLMNTSIILLGMLCLGLGIFWFQNYQSDISDQAPQEKAAASNEPISAENPPLGPITIAELQQEWDECYSEGRIMADLERLQDLAKTLETHGNPLPLEQVHFISLARSQPKDTSLIIPHWALAVTKDGSIELAPKAQLNLSPHQFTLLPAIFHAELKYFLNAHPEEISRQVADPNRFDLTSIERRIRECQRNARATLTSIPTDRREAASEYITQSEAASRNENLMRLNQVGRKLEQPPYFSFDSSGLVSQHHAPNYKHYLYEIFDAYMVARYRAFKRSPEFSIALTTASSRNFDTPISAAKAMRNAFQNAQAEFESATQKLETAQRSWDDAFHSEDPMKEALISFNIEQLEATRSHLATLSSRFTKNELEAVRNAETIQHDSDRLLERAQNSTLDQEWIVIPIQTTQLP